MHRSSPCSRAKRSAASCVRSSSISSGPLKPQRLSSSAQLLDFTGGFLRLRNMAFRDVFSFLVVSFGMVFGDVLEEFLDVFGDAGKT